MKKEFSRLLSITFLLLISLVAPLTVATGPTQPDPGTGLIDTTTLYVGTIGWGPRYADPVRAFDTASRELLFNVYDTLIGMGSPVSNFWKNNWDVEEQYWRFEPILATNVPTRVEVLKDFVYGGDIPIVVSGGGFDFWGVFISGHDDGLGPVFDKTASDIYDMFHAAGYIGFPLPQATWVDVQAGISFLKQVANNNDVVVFYYCGHGFRRADGDPASTDEPLNEYRQKNSMEDYSEPAFSPMDEGICLNEWVTDDDLGQELAGGWQSPDIRIILIFDCCFAGGMIDGQKDPGATLRNNICIILMAQERHWVAWKTEDLVYPVFSNFLLEGLNNLEADTNPRDGTLTAEELFDYANPKTRAHIQTIPEIYNRDNDGDGRVNEDPFGDADGYGDQGDDSDSSINEDPRDFQNPICGPRMRWVDNNPDSVFGSGDVVYLMDYEGESRTWQVISVDNAPPRTIFHLHRFYYDFNIRTDDGHGNRIRFYDESGNPVDTFDIYDAEYSFERGLVQDQGGSPMWMFYKPFFDQMNSEFWDTGDPTYAIDLAYLINDAVEIMSIEPNPQTLRINVGISFPDTAFKQIMCQTWASMVSKAFSRNITCWDGDLFIDQNHNGLPDWWDSGMVRRVSRSPYDVVGAYRYVGTGPYYVKVFDSINFIVVLERNAGYWKGWPATDRKAFLQRIDIEYIADWAPRRDAFIACQLDVCAVPRAFMSELLDQYMEPKYPEIKTIKNISPSLTMDSMHFTFTVDPTSPYLLSGHFPDGIPPDFFNNIHVRQAFAHGFDREAYIRDTWMREAICRETPLIYGLVPDYYTKSPDPPYTYDYSQAQAEANLKLAMFGGTSVWDSGFKLGLAYNEGNDQRRIACEMLRNFFGALSYYDGRIGKPPFNIEVSEVGGAAYLDFIEEFKLPMWSMGWPADFADADNFVRPYMHSYGYFAFFQNYTWWNGWTIPGPRTGFDKDTLIDLAVKTNDSDPNRAKYYADLDDIYIIDCPSFPIAQGLGRRFCKYWVKGWYYNALYQSDYYYKMYKEQACWADITSHIVGVPDRVCDMRDIGYIAQHFGAEAPKPSAPVIYDVDWAPGTYGCGGCDVYGDRIVDMRDIGFACKHFGDTTGP